MVVWACIFAKHAVLQNPFNVSCLLAYPCVYIYNIYIYIYMVGGFIHFSLFIIDGIILPIDYFFKMVKTC